MSTEMRHVFIIGCKGIPARYGGFETFVEKLTENRVSSRIRYHVACAVDELPREPEFEYNEAHCFFIKWRPFGVARAIAYDLDALKWAIRYSRVNKIERPVFYVLACRIGPFVGRYAKAIHAIGGVLLVNPDGHEWMRAKWSAPVRKYWKLSEAGMVKHADHLVCDSRNIESYIQNEYSRFVSETTYIAYGADVTPSKMADNDPSFLSWINEKGLAPKDYYLVVGRFVPENNYETMIREFMASKTTKSFALITSAEDDFLHSLEERTGFRKDSRIRFVGTVYDQDLLKKIRENAFAYLHGHEVGGTNPSLLEAMSSTQLNLLFDVGFNREVAENSALYWTKNRGSLSTLIEEVDSFSKEKVNSYDESSLKQVRTRYSWTLIVSEYEHLFLNVKDRTTKNGQSAALKIRRQI